MTHTLTIANWHPAAANELMWKHWGVAGRRKKADKRLVVIEAMRQGTPVATGRRRVDLHLVLRKGQKERDPDSWWKSALDCCVAAKLLTDDDRKGVELGAVSYGRSGDSSFSTTFTLTDVPPAEPIRKARPKAKKGASA